MKDKATKEKYFEIKLRCPFCLNNDKIAPIVQYIHGNCGGKVELSNSANIRCQKCGKTCSVTEAIFADCNKDVYLSGEQNYNDRKVKIESKETNEYEFAHKILISAAGQITSLAGREWLYNFMKSLDTTSKSQDDKK